MHTVEDGNTLVGHYLKASMVHFVVLYTFQLDERVRQSEGERENWDREREP